MDYSDRRKDFDRASLVVLQHLYMVDDYVARHKESIAKKYRDKRVLKTDGEVTVEHNTTFLRWFKEQVLENPPEEGSSDGLLIHALAHGHAPSSRPINPTISMGTRSTWRPKTWIVITRTPG